MFRTADVHGHFSEFGGGWDNDLSLVDELKNKGEISSESLAATADLDIRETLGQVVERLIRAGRIPKTARSSYDSDGLVSREAQARIDEAIAAVMIDASKRASVDSAMEDLVSQSEQVFRLMMFYTGNGRGRRKFDTDYRSRIDKLPREQFPAFVSKFKIGVEQTRVDEESGGEFRGKGWKPCFQLLDMLLNDSRSSSGGLFAGTKE